MLASSSSKHTISVGHFVFKTQIILASLPSKHRFFVLFVFETKKLLMQRKKRSGQPEGGQLSMMYFIINQSHRYKLDVLMK
jgi:hypothetical protein